MIGGCQGTEFGCCCDNITAANDASGSNCIGGCCGTPFGCCPYSTESKVDREGTNCGTIAGSVLYTTVGAIPSNVPLKRVWDLNLTGYLQPNVGKYYIFYDFTNVNYQYKDKITSEDQLSGTFNICGQVLDATKYLDYHFCDANLTLTIMIYTRKWDFRLKKKAIFSYQLNVNDSSSCPGLPSSLTNSSQTFQTCLDYYNSKTFYLSNTYNGTTYTVTVEYVASETRLNCTIDPFPQYVDGFVTDIYIVGFQSETISSYKSDQNDQVTYNIYSCNANGTYCEKVSSTPGNGGSIYGSGDKKPNDCNNSVSSVYNTVCATTTNTCT